MNNFTNQRGIVLPMVLAIILIVTILGFSAMSVAENQTIMVSRHQQREQALHYAEAGINCYMAELNKSPYNNFTAPSDSIAFQDGYYKILSNLFPSAYYDTTPIFRRVPNLFEIVTLEYWRKNYDYKLTESKLKWKEAFLNDPSGLKHVINVLNYKLKLSGKTDEEIDKVSMEEKLLSGDAFFGGGHELIIANKHFIDTAEWDTE